MKENNSNIENFFRLKNRKENILFSVKLREDFFVPLKSLNLQDAIEECKKYFLPVECIIEN